MKTLTILLLPPVLLITGCVYLNADWPYYAISWFAGFGIGTLALFTWFQVCEKESKTKIKINEKDKTY